MLPAPLQSLVQTHIRLELAQLRAAPEPHEQIAFRRIDGRDIGEQLRMAGQNYARREVEHEALIENSAFLRRRDNTANESPELARFSLVHPHLLRTSHATTPHP